MNKPFVYAIGDVHGSYDLFQKLLTHYDLHLHQLVLIGDLNDRGPKTKDCLLLGMKLVKETGAIYLRGNHEEYFLQFLQEPEDWYPSYLRNGGRETMESLLHPGAAEEYSPTEIAMMIRSRYRELVDFLCNLPLYYEWENYLFVHAGVDLTKKIGVILALEIFYGSESLFMSIRIGRVRRSYLVIRSRHYSMEICRQLIYGYKIRKSGSTVGLSLADQCMVSFLIQLESSKISSIKTIKDHGNHVIDQKSF